MRKIYMDKQSLTTQLLAFKTFLENCKTNNSKINYSVDLAKIDDKEEAIVNFTTEAYLKMLKLMMSEKGEIGWHGIVSKKEKGMYIIEDILMYPQTVTGTTVQTDDLEYGNWLHTELTEEQINTLRFHGHSHVNMGVSPSGTDTSWYDEILQTLAETDFYIFMIINKSHNVFIEIYELSENKIYETADINVNIMLNKGDYLDNWIDQTKKKNLKEEVKPETQNINYWKEDGGFNYEAYQKILEKQRQRITKPSKKERRAYD